MASTASVPKEVPTATAACSRGGSGARTAEAITDSFKEVVVAPGYTDAALDVLCRKENLRVLRVGDLGEVTERLTEKPLVGGRLVQERDLQSLSAEDLEVVVPVEKGATDVKALLGDERMVKHFERTTPLGRIGEPGDIARVIAFLVGPDSGWLSGQVITADGGIIDDLAQFGAVNVPANDAGYLPSAGFLREQFFELRDVLNRALGLQLQVL